MSDEGLMTGDIEDCLDVVVKAVRKSDLPAAEVLAWCMAMRNNDCVDFIARAMLQALQAHCQRTASR